MTSSNCGISVAMATYNGEKYIREQLESIARQTVLPIELVVTDDGSKDETLSILEDFERGAPFPVRIFSNESRLGYADNFFKAASLCQGDLIAFCDQDDVWMEKKLEKCLEQFSRSNVVLVAHSSRTLSESDAPGRHFPPWMRTRIFEHGSSDPFEFVYGFAIVIRREVLDIMRGLDRPSNLRGHDQWCWFLAASSGSIATLADELALYRQHEKNLFGAPQHSALARLQTAAKAVAYDQDADSKLECARFLRQAAVQNPNWASTLQKSSAHLERRSTIYRLRAKIYRTDSTLWSRTLSFFKILFLAGYLSDPPPTRLGPRAAIKDFLFGVFGIYKLSYFRH